MVSVIIDNYNYEKFISEAIESVLNQTYKDYEIIIVDDGSTDSSKDVILKYCNKYPDLITAVFKPNGGQASAFNAAFKLCRGDIVCFLDSDDYWYNNKLEKVLEYHKDYDFVAHNKNYPTGRPIIFSEEIINKRRRLLKKYGETFFLATSTLSFNKDLLNIIFPIPEKEFRLCADSYIFLYALYLSDIKYTNEILSFYRIHSNNNFIGTSKTKNTEELSLNAVKAVNKKLTELNKPIIPYMNFNLRQKELEIEQGIIIEKNKDYVIYGTGSYSQSVKEFLNFCGANVRYYCDSNNQKWNTYVDKIKVVSPKELVEKRNKYFKIYIASMWFYEISRSLEELGLKKDLDFIYSEVEF